MIRPAKFSDIPMIAELGEESLLVNDPYPELRISKDKIHEMAKELVTSASHFAWVSEIDGKVVGAVCGYASDMLFYERKQLSVVMYYCRVSRDGGRLIKKLVEWYKTRPILKMLVFTLEGHSESKKLGDFLISLGLNKVLPNYVGVK